jgi:hypothetical protein
VHQKHFCDSSNSNELTTSLHSDITKSVKSPQAVTISPVESHLSSQSAISEVSLTNPTIGFILLNFIAILWGSQHVVIKSILSTYHYPSLLNFLRFSFSSLLFLPAFITAIVSTVFILIMIIFFI